MPLHITAPSKPRTATLSALLLSFGVSAAAIHASAQHPASPQQSARTVARGQQQATDAYLAGAKLLERNDLTGAEKNFRRAVELDPANPDFPLALTVAREHRLSALVQSAAAARLAGHPEKSSALLAEARELDPQNAIVTQHLDPVALGPGLIPRLSPGEGEPASSLSRTPGFTGPITLTPSDDVRSFHIHADTRSILRQVFANYGIRAVFDDSAPQQQFKFDLDNVTYPQIVPTLLRLTQVFAVPLDATSVLIAKDTAENRLKLERQIQETVSIPGATPEQMTELGNLVRSVFDIRTASVQNNANTLVLRAPANTLQALNITLADLIDGSAQVTMEVRLYAVDRTRTRAIGPQLPQQFGVYNVAGAAQQLVSANQTLVNQAIAQGVIPANSTNIQIAAYLVSSGLVQSSLLSSTLGFFGGGLTLTGLTVGSANFSLALNSSDSRALDDIRLRVGDRQTGTFRVGTRFPITTATYTTSSASASASLAGVTVNGVSASSLLSQYLGTTNTQTIPQIQYEDLGVTLKATPTVQKAGSVVMHLDLKIEALAGGAIDNIPILANRQFISDITVADGETALMVSSISRTELRAISGTPGVSDLPGFGTVASDRTGEKDTGDLVLLITPHVVRRRTGTVAGPRIALNSPLGSSE